MQETLQKYARQIGDWDHQLRCVDAQVLVDEREDIVIALYWGGH